MIDYVLNAAVGISAGVGALTSAVPSLHPYTLALCLLILLLVTILNLRGTVDAGRAWALPTYLFTVSFILILAIGVHKTLAAGGRPPPVVPPAPLPDAREVVSIWLLLRSFAAGCTAMTGVDCLSSSVRLSVNEECLSCDRKCCQTHNINGVPTILLLQNGMSKNPAT